MTAGLSWYEDLLAALEASERIEWRSPLQVLCDRECLREILVALSPAELVIALLRVEGWTNAEIATALEVSPATVRTSIHAARRRLLCQLPQETARFLS